MKSQEQDVLDYIREFGSITNIEAMNELGVGRLAARIHDLRSRGHKIESVPTKAINRKGRMSHFVRYELKE